MGAGGGLMGRKNSNRAIRRAGEGERRTTVGGVAAGRWDGSINGLAFLSTRG